MEDNNGLYYYPDPQDPKTRVYVRPSSSNPGSVQFRLWRGDHPQVWEQHPWLDYAVIAEAAAKYADQSDGRNPLALYDLDVAKVLLRDKARKTEKNSGK